jgi:hypothetical protein
MKYTQLTILSLIFLSLFFVPVPSGAIMGECSPACASNEICLSPGYSGSTLLPGVCQTNYSGNNSGTGSGGNTGSGSSSGSGGTNAGAAASQAACVTGTQFNSEPYGDGVVYTMCRNINGDYINVCRGTETTGVCAPARIDPQAAADAAAAAGPGCVAHRYTMPVPDRTTGLMYFYGVDCSGSPTGTVVSSISKSSGNGGSSNGSLGTSNQINSLNTYASSLANIINNMVQVYKNILNGSNTGLETSTLNQSIYNTYIAKAVFTSNASGIMHVGDTWGVVVTGLNSGETIYATGGKKINGVVPTDKTPYYANNLGVYIKTGIHTTDVVGDWQIVWTRADGTVLGTLVFSVQ